MLALVPASPKVDTRMRSIQQRSFRPIEKVISYATSRPYCTRQIHVSLGERATVRGACNHFAEVEQRDDRVLVAFSLRVE
jgi:hypothetical protein